VPPASKPSRGGVAEPQELVIVGLGASAGGLAALEQVLKNVPPTLGAAYVVVQHLDPEHASMLVELLQRVCALPVVEVTDGVKVRPDTVHVIPPNREMELFDGTLLLTVPNAPRGQRMAIDSFFRSLADEQGPRAVGVVLSGTGSDGALGLEAIHAAGGLCFVQDAASAGFDGMPAAALRAVRSAVVATAEQLPAALSAALSKRRPQLATGAERASAAGLGRVLSVLRSVTGRDFSQYKRSSILRRIERRMGATSLATIELYARHLREHPAEVKTLLQELLINVTTFFRDPEAFVALRAALSARLAVDGFEGNTLRVWVGGCASGEEAYSIAIVLRELMEEQHSTLKVQIYGTDLDEEAIAMARAGVYPATIAAHVSPERLGRFFVLSDAGYRVKQEIREQVVFAVQDLIKDPPFTRIDLISCRNVFIYLEPELQTRLLTLFHYALRPGGLLFLSPAESVGENTSLFVPIDRKWRVFRTRPNPSSARAVLTSGLSWVKGQSGVGEARLSPATDFGELTRRLLLQTYAPASVLTDKAGRILFVHGETGAYLRPAPGQPSLSVIDMARDALQVDLRAALSLAATRGKPTVRSGIPAGHTGSSRSVDVTVRPVSAAGSEGLLLVTFQEAKAAPATSARGKNKLSARTAQARRIAELTRSLDSTRENLQATIEEQQTSHEELQSTNEELQSTNEEVQASNEELETAKEELQSVNEELTTVNAELQARVEQLNGMQDDLKNLFEAISVGTVFLDEQLLVKRFSREAVRIYRLAPGDVGRPLADIKSDLLSVDLLADARGVLDSLVPREREVQTTNERWYLARVVPYRTVDNVIRGVVLTFTDITKRVLAEQQANAERELALRVVDSVREPLLVLDVGLRVVSASRAFHQAFSTTPEGIAGRHVYELADRRWDVPKLRELLEHVLPRDRAFEGFALAADGQTTTYSLSGRRIVGKVGAAELILLSFER
jgi:two-component system, chemotaxis family, CheB/CheR fusion protein